MNVILDLAIVAIAVLSIVLAATKGFFRTLLSGSAFLLALILTVALVAPVRNLFAQSAIYDNTRESISGWISDTVMHTISDLEEVTEDKLHEHTIEHTTFSPLISSLGLDIESLVDGFDTSSKEAIEKSVNEFADTLGEQVASALVALISALLLFIVFFIAIKLLAKFMANVIKKIPVLKTADSLLGAVLGIIFGVVRIFAFVSIMHLLVPVMQTSQSAFIAGVDPASTLLFGFFYNVNLFAFLI